MRRPFGEANLGAVTGAVVGSIGGLFAVGIGEVIIHGSLVWLMRFPLLSVLSWLVSLPVGWLLGGQIGPQLGERFRSMKGEIAGGVVGGLVPVVAIAFLGWYLANSN